MTIYNVGLAKCIGAGVQEELREDDCDQPGDSEHVGRKHISKIGPPEQTYPKDEANKPLKNGKSSTNRSILVTYRTFIGSSRGS